MFAQPLQECYFPKELSLTSLYFSSFGGQDHARSACCCGYHTAHLQPSGTLKWIPVQQCTALPNFSKHLNDSKLSLILTVWSLHVVLNVPESAHQPSLGWYHCTL